MRINKEIRAPKVRVIGSDGKQVGVITPFEAMKIAESEGLDLVEISPNAEPPVCKIIDYGKYRYQQTKKEKESKKSQHQIKVKEIKVKPNINQHDLDIKLKHTREFIEKGCKVKITCMFRGREMMFANKGKEVVDYLIEQLQDIAAPESEPKMLGRNMIAILAPGSKGAKATGSMGSGKDKNENE